jgi:hypothetical protein
MRKNDLKITLSRRNERRVENVMLATFYVDACPLSRPYEAFATGRNKQGQKSFRALLFYVEEDYILLIKISAPNV